jgi:hypothetical protein
MANTALTPLKTEQVNSQSAIEARVAAGRVPWAGPLLLVIERPLLIVGAQAVTALVLFLLHRAAPWHEAGHWWTVYGTLVDIGCLAGMLYFTRREGIRLRDLTGPIRLRWGRDVFLGLGYFLLIFPLFLLGGTLAHKWLYAPGVPDPGAYLVQSHFMPTWAIVYSLSIWWMIWSPTEEATYQAYVLPRLRALTGRVWIAFVIVGFLWAFQHALLPFIPDARYILFRTLAFTPGVLAFMAIYWRTRRLAPLIVAHWPMDIAGALMMTLLAR